MARPARMPVLQLHGADDPCVLESTVLRSRRWAAGPFTHHPFDATGHFPHEERPAETTALLTKFLRG
jgi:pimeloyl-ACP methyl ester carboxylesterase